MLNIFFKDQDYSLTANIFKSKFNSQRFMYISFETFTFELDRS